MWVNEAKPSLAEAVNRAMQYTQCQTTVPGPVILPLLQRV